MITIYHPTDADDLETRTDPTTGKKEPLTAVLVSRPRVGVQEVDRRTGAQAKPGNFDTRTVKRLFADDYVLPAGAGGPIFKGRVPCSDSEEAGTVHVDGISDFDLSDNGEA